MKDFMAASGDEWLRRGVFWLFCVDVGLWWAILVSKTLP